MIKHLGKLKGKILIFGGPYSNLAATEAMHRVAIGLNIPAANIICTGDTIAYCSQPRETVDLLRCWGCHVVLGNCEESLASDADDCGCGFGEDTSCSLLSVEWYRYAKEHTPNAHKQWMATLPERITFQLSGKDFLIVHGSVHSINEFVFESTDSSYTLDQISHTNSDVVIGGHCGLPFGQALDDEKYWLNSGVIGMSANDGSQSGWYMLLSPEGNTIKASWHRLHYDTDKTANAMLENNLCLPYAQSLKNGLWPSEEILPDRERSQKGKAISIPDLLIL